MEYQKNPCMYQRLCTDHKSSHFIAQGALFSVVISLLLLHESEVIFWVNTSEKNTVTSVEFFVTADAIFKKIDVG